MTVSKNTKQVSLLSLLIVASLLLSGCGAAAKPTVTEQEAAPTARPPEATPTPVGPEPTAPPEAEEPVFGGVFVYAMDVVPPTLDTQSTSAYATRQVTANAMETLVAFGEDYSVVPMLAASWDISDDGLTYTFHLREGVKFHNGKEMTSEDVIASMERFLDVTTRGGTFGMLESYEATDEYTVVMHLGFASAAFLGNLATPQSPLAIFPKEIIQGKASGELEAEELIGTGPYELVEYQPDQMAVFKRFEDYQPLPGERDGLGGAKIAYFDEIRILFVPETGARMAGLEAGEYDMIIAPSFADLDRIEANAELQLFINKHGEGLYVSFNHANELSSDIKFRQAVLAAMDMDSLGLAMMNGRRELFALNESLWPPFTDWYIGDDPVAKAQYNQNDPEKARQLLEESGYDGEQIILITTRDYEDRFRLIMAVSDQLVEKLGMNTKVDVYDWAGYLSKLSETSGWHIGWMGMSTMHLVNPNAAYGTWGCEADPPWNPHYCNAEVEAAFDVLDKAATDEERKAALSDVQRTFWEGLPYFKVLDCCFPLAAQHDIRGFEGWYFTRFWGVWRQQ